MVTRRTTQRQFLLKPTRAVTQAFLYCLACAAEQTGVVVHAVCALSNHYHIVCTDPFGRLPKFAEELNKLVAKCLNAHHGRWENFWAGGTEASYVRLETPVAVLEKTVYTLANPVAAGLIKDGKDWPGLRLWKPGRYRVKRPNFFFRAEGKMPKSIELRISPPPIGGDASEALESIRTSLEKQESAIRSAFRQSGRRFLGRAFVLRQKITDSPNTKEPRRSVSPRVATRDKWKRVEILQRIKGFIDDYKEALARWTLGDRSVIFPAGTYRMRVLHNVLCEEP